MHAASDHQASQRARGALQFFDLSILLFRGLGPYVYHWEENSQAQAKGKHREG